MTKIYNCLTSYINILSFLIIYLVVYHYKRCMEETNASGRKESEYGSAAQLISNEYQQNVQRKH